MDTSEPTADYRLPDDVMPHRYVLSLRPDLESLTFTGTATIEIEARRPAERVVLHAVELEIASVTLHPDWDVDPELEPSGEPIAFALEEETERLILTPETPLSEGRYRLSFAFSGVLNDKLRGFYRSLYSDDEGVERVIATTQFESTDARRAFPCFDEPDRKASFAVTLEAPPGMLALSNGPELSREALADGWVRFHFGETIPMSTYLVAFVVGPLEATEPVDVDGVALRVVHLPGKSALTGPAIDVATHALRFFADYFALPYPGEKVDLVAVPDFAAGAMENLGCVTFREAILLADPEDTARTEMERMAEVVEHELAHMWFGDLVTMGWWNGIWLNEAFATFMSLVCQDDYRPEWQCFVSFARGKAAAFSVDGLHTTRPIEFPVHHPDEAQAMFDVLTYEKGASVLWMIESYIGRERFRDGVRSYLAKHKYANTETGDLWDALEAAAPEIPIRAVMDSWIFTGGHPLVEARHLEDGGVELEQRPFAYLASLPDWSEGPSAIGSDWLVPVLAAPPGGEVSERVILGAEPVRLTSTAPLVVNAGGAGFYRLSYDPALRAELTPLLGRLTPIERYNVLADTLAVVLSGNAQVDEFLALLGGLSSESDPHVWSVALGGLGLIDLVAADAERPPLTGAVRHLLAPHLEQIGWEPRPDEDEGAPMLRSSLIAALGSLGDDPEVIARARELFALDHAGTSTVDADIASAVLAVTLAHATREEFDAVLERYRHPINPMDEIRHLNALAAVTDPDLAAEVQRLCLEEIRSQNAPYLLGGMLRNREIGELSFAFLTSHFDEILERFPESSIHRMLDGISGLARLEPSGEARSLGSVRAFVTSRIEGGRRRLVDQSLERLEVNVAFARAIRGHVAEALGAAALTR